jgi:hypothetical protein
MMLGTPLVAHAVIHSRPSDFLDRPTPEFLRNFLNFGFLFERDDFSLPERTGPVWIAAAALIAALVCLGFAVRSFRDRQRTTDAVPAEGDTAAIAFGMSVVTLGLAGMAWSRPERVVVAAGLPVALWLMLSVLPAVWGTLERLRTRLPHPRLGEGVVLSLLLALVPVVAVSLVSLQKPIMTSRALTLFTPMLVAALSAGLVAATRFRLLGAVLGVVVLSGHVASVAYYRSVPAPNDYRGLARQMKREFQSGDMVFVPARSWVTTPLFYDLQGTAPKVVADSLDARLRRQPNARIWVPLFSDQEPSSEIIGALRGRRVEKTLLSFRSRALLYVPDFAGIER